MSDTQPKRNRRAEPITRRVAKNGSISWEFRADVGTRPDGSRDRRRFTYRTQAEARKELRRIDSEVAAGTYARRTAITVDEACDEWLAGRRGIRTGTVENYRDWLKPVRRHLGGKRLQQLTKGDVDSLVEWMLTAGRRSPKHHQPGSLMSRVVELVGQHPEGITAAAIRAAFPADDVHTCLSGLKRAGRVAQPRRAVYVLAPEADTAARGLKPVSVRNTLTAFGMVVQSFMDQGALPRNVVALADRPADEGRTVTSWTAAEAEQFRESVRDHRLFACWLLSLYGLRRSEVLGLKWSDLTDDGVLRIERSRVEVAGGWEFGDVKSVKRSKRSLPLPPELPEVLRALRMRQKTEALALGVSWSDDRLIAVREDGEPVRHDWYSAEFARLRDRAGLSEVSLKRLRNTSVSLMMDRGIPVHIVAAWHGHDPAVSLSIYADAKQDELRAAGAALFG